MAKQTNPAVKAARTRRTRATKTGIKLTTGIEVRLLPVAISIINEAQAAVPEPEVPLWFNENTGENEPNPNHPDYIKALEELETQKNLAAIDAMIFFGVEVLGGIPDPDTWLPKLLFAHRKGFMKLDIEGLDMNDPMELEFIYKKYIAVGATDLPRVMEVAGITEEMIQQQADTFPNNS